MILEGNAWFQFGITLKKMGSNYFLAKVMFLLSSYHLLTLDIFVRKTISESLGA